jgi:hypothetical protein
VPRQIDGAPTDVVETDFQLEGGAAPFPPLPDKERYLSLVGGISVGPKRLLSAGTLGIMVRQNGGPTEMMLSNYHVLCGTDNQHQAGDEICQQARIDNWLDLCGNCAGLSTWVLSGNFMVNRTPTGGPAAVPVPYGLDAAVAMTTTALRIKSVGVVCDVGALQFSPNVTARVGTIVQKRGKQSLLTQGVINSVTLAVTVDYGVLGNLQLENMVEVISTNANPFSLPGDSGSVYFDLNKNLMGLHVGGGGGHSFGTPIDVVMNYFGVHI